MESRARAAVGEPASTFSCGMQRGRHPIPPSPPPPLSNTHQPPAQLPGQGGLGFPYPPIPFQRLSVLQTCLCITLFTSNCYLVALDQEQSSGGNRAL